MEEKLRALGVADEPNVSSPTPGVNTPLVRKNFVPFVTLMLIQCSPISQALLLTRLIPSHRQFRPVRLFRILMQLPSRPLRRSRSLRPAPLAPPSRLRHSTVRLDILVSIFLGSQCRTLLVLRQRKVMMAGITTPSHRLFLAVRLRLLDRRMFGVRRSASVAQMVLQCMAIRNRYPILALLV